MSNENDPGFEHFQKYFQRTLLVSMHIENLLTTEIDNPPPPEYDDLVIVYNPKKFVYFEIETMIL